MTIRRNIFFPSRQSRYIITLDYYTNVKSFRKGVLLLPTRKPTAVDLFCGCGGVTEGLKQAGFSVIAAVDNDPVCCRTYTLNHPEVTLLQNDIIKTSAQEIKRLMNGQKLDLLVVCAPCQPFSSLNKSKKPDEREYLILQAARFARALRPRYVLFENVPGLTKKSAIVQTLEQQFQKLGYNLSEPHQVDAADYEVPQRRVRCVIVASRRSAPAFVIPQPVTPENHRITVKMTIKDLPEAPQDNNPKDKLHFSRAHSAKTLERLRCISHDGGSRNELPDHLILPCHKKLDDAGEMTHYCDVYGRMKWNSVAPTLTTGCTDVTKGRYAHPCKDRAITLREAALLQTFPAKYNFSGNSGDMARQIGNAVPVNLVKNVAAFFIP